MNDIFEIRIHGRGGQGSVTAAELIAVAVFYEGKYSQAFPNFGVERRGAPVEAYVRISEKPIRLRSQVYNPNVIIIQDATLVNTVDVFKGLQKNGLVIINSEKNNFVGLKNKNVLAVPITKIAMELLGRPATNTGLLAAFSQATGLVNFDSLKKAVAEKFSSKPELVSKNVELMETIKKDFNKNFNI
jgi:pyruvate ferredoxin oxidoreductase gamma subunit